MVVNLKYDNYMDSLSKDDLSTHIVNKLVLSWKTFGLKDITSPNEYVKLYISKHLEMSNRDLWNLLILKLLNKVSKAQKMYFMESYIENLINSVNKQGLPDNIENINTALNSMLTNDHLVLSICDYVGDEDYIIKEIVALKEEIRVATSKYITIKNIDKDFLHNITTEENVANPHFQLFDVIFDVFIMCLLPTMDDIFMNGLQYNELEIRSYVFEATEHYAHTIAIKNKEKLADAICQTIATAKLSMEAE